MRQAGRQHERALRRALGQPRTSETGIVVEPGDAKALAKRIERLLNDAALRERMGEAGRARVLRDFTLEAMAASTAALYREVVSAGRAAAWQGPQRPRNAIDDRPDLPCEAWTGALALAQARPGLATPVRAARAGGESGRVGHLQRDLRRPHLRRDHRAGGDDGACRTGRWS